MAEVQTNTQSGEMSQRFIEFVMMQAQNAALFLGQIPNPQTGKGEVNLELAKMFIDQLAMIQEKTRGNLTNEETAVLRNTLSNLQMAFVEVSRQVREGTTESDKAPEPQEAEAEAEEPAPPPSAEKIEPARATAEAESESRKKFTKSYGA
jgi:polyhydroxyalkanoate synthesis regulator phasin